MAKQRRLMKEVKMLKDQPTEGISCYPKDDQLSSLSASVMGPEDSPYKGGLFQLEIQIPDNYPYEPPRIKFLTPVYHPNIDKTGLICLDLLKMPPKGGWKPTICLANLLVAVRDLLGDPNPDDPLEGDIANEFKMDYNLFASKARKHTQENAMKKRKHELDKH